MLALVNTPNGPAPIELRDIADPDPARKEALVEVHAFSLNRGELASFARNKEGWVPGQDIAGVVLCQAANGAGPAVGTRVVALVDDFGWADHLQLDLHDHPTREDVLGRHRAAEAALHGKCFLGFGAHESALRPQAAKESADHR